jgi:methionyl-tRNA formyltransferase
MKSEMPRVGYIGYEPDTFVTLAKDNSVNVLFSAKIPWLAEGFGGLFDKFLSWAYNGSRSSWVSKKIRLLVITAISPLFGDHARRYSEYVRIHLIKNIPVIDIEEKRGIEEIRRLSLDLAVVSYWGMFDEELITMFPLGLVNIHPSLLPKYRGALPTLWSLKNHDKCSGVAFMILQKGMDTGPLLEVVKFDIEDGATWLDVEHSVSSCVTQRLAHCLCEYKAGARVPMQQDSEGVVYTEKYTPYMKIDPTTERFEDVNNKIGLYPFFDPAELCYFLVNEKKYFVKGCAKYSKSTIQSKIEKKEDGILVRFIDGVLFMQYDKDIDQKDAEELVVEYSK